MRTRQILFSRFKILYIPNNKTFFFTLIFFLTLFAQSESFSQNDIYISKRVFSSSIFSGNNADTILGRNDSSIGKPKLYLVRTPPVWTLQFTGAFNLGFAELSSNYADVFDAQQFYNGENFGVRYGFGVQATAKNTLNEKGNMRLIMSSSYNYFSSQLFSKKSPFGNVRYNVLSIGGGIENNFNPKYRLRPYISFEADLNMIFGKAVITTDTSSTEANIKNSFRIGFIICAGFEYLVNNSYGITLGARITNANQVLKQSKTEEDDTNIHLRDKRVNPKLFLSGFKNFTFISIYAGVDLYFGIVNQWFQIK